MEHRMCNLDLKGLTGATSRSPNTTMDQEMEVELNKNPPQALFQQCTVPVQHRLLPQAANCQPLIRQRPTTSRTMHVVCLVVEPVRCFLHIPREHRNPPWTNTLQHPAIIRFEKNHVVWRCAGATLQAIVLENLFF